MTSKPILKKADIDKIPERSITHPFNDKAVINMKSLSEAAGLSALGVHMIRIAPGDESTACHNHEISDEFVYILSGNASLFVGEEEYELGPDDFTGFPANGPAHYMKNTGNDDLIFLVAGTRPSTDVINYPDAGKKMYQVDGRLDVVDTVNIGELKRRK